MGKGVLIVMKTRDGLGKGQIIIIQSRTHARMAGNLSRSFDKITPMFRHKTIMSLWGPRIEGLWKHCRKMRKCWLPGFSPFPTVFSTLLKANFNIWVSFIFSSANVSIWIGLKFLLSAKELKARVWPSSQVSFVLFFYGPASIDGGI